MSPTMAATGQWTSSVIFLCIICFTDGLRCFSAHYDVLGPDCRKQRPSPTAPCSCDLPFIPNDSIRVQFIVGTPTDPHQKNWNLTARIEWEPPTPDEQYWYSVSFQPLKTPQELAAETSDPDYNAHAQCGSDVQSTNCDHPFFHNQSNETFLDVTDLLFGFSYKLRIQVLQSEVSSQSYSCITPHEDQFACKPPRTLAPDCYETTRDESYCSQYPVQIASKPINVRASVEALDVYYVITVEWNRPLRLNGMIDEYTINLYKLNESFARIKKLSTPSSFDRIEVKDGAIRNYSSQLVVTLDDDFSLNGTYEIEIGTRVFPSNYPLRRLGGNMESAYFDFAELTADDTSTAYISSVHHSTAIYESSSTHVENTSGNHETATTTNVTVKQIGDTAGIPSINWNYYVIVTAVGLLATVAAVIAMCGLYQVCSYRKRWPKSLTYLPHISQHSMPPRKKPNSVADEFKEKEILDRGRLSIGGLLGTGQYGVVFKGLLTGVESDKQNTVVAIKQPRVPLADGARENFLKEVKLMIDMERDIKNHPNISLIIGCCTMDDPLCLITEFMKYGQLLEFLRNCQRCRLANDIQDPVFILSEMNQLQIALQIAKGMAYLSSKRYFHGDLAARNILVGDDLVVKISDFGFSRDIYQTGYDKLRRDERRPVKWYSPEANKHGVCSEKGDVWSFGVVLWEIFSLGDIPYTGLEGDQVFKKIEKGYRLGKPEECPFDSYKIMMQCWEYKPVERPSFKQLEDQVEEMLCSVTKGSYLHVTEVDETRGETRREGDANSETISLSSFVTNDDFPTSTNSSAALLIVNDVSDGFKEEDK